MSPSALLVALPLLAAAAAAAVADNYPYCFASSIGYINGRIIQYGTVPTNTPRDIHFPPVCAAAQGLLVVACVSAPPMPTVTVVSLNEANIRAQWPVNALVTGFAFCADNAGGAGAGGARATHSEKDILSLIGALPGGGMMLPLNAGAPVPTPAAVPAERYQQLRWN